MKIATKPVNRPVKIFLNPKNLILNNSLKNNIFKENILMEEDFEEALNLILVSYDNYTDQSFVNFDVLLMMQYNNNLKETNL